MILLKRLSVCDVDLIDQYSKHTLYPSIEVGYTACQPLMLTFQAFRTLLKGWGFVVKCRCYYFCAMCGFSRIPAL
jgi:hypothetical protein